jgi:hypothetical protein
MLANAIPDVTGIPSEHLNGKKYVIIHYVVFIFKQI